MVLDRRRDDVVAEAGLLLRGRHALDRRVDRLSSGAREEDLAGPRAEQRRHSRAGVVDRAGGLAAERV
ncbi:MAG: hypothetical protein IIA35_08615, partial [Proteobacteria bacterium]|nr:hypothetical protein [Pseudomonadota bacterium]